MNFLSEGFKGQGDERAGVSTCGKNRALLGLEVVEVDWAFLANFVVSIPTCK